MTEHPFADPSPSLALAGRGERIAPRALLVCDRCWQPTTMTVPWTTSLDGKRVLMRCCLQCSDDMAPRSVEALERARAEADEIVRWQEGEWP